MKRAFLVFCFLVCSAVGALAQQSVIPAPECRIDKRFTATGTSAELDNRERGCTDWTVTYSVSGYSAVSLSLQDAPDSADAAGTWEDWSGTIVAGSNPATDTSRGSILASDFFPWVRLKLNSATGTGYVDVHLKGSTRKAASITAPALNPLVAGALVPNTSTVIATPADPFYTDGNRTFALTSDDKCRFVYLDDGNTELWLAEQSGATCATTTKTKLVDDADGLDFPQLAIGSDGKTRVAWLEYSSPANKIHLGTCDATACTTITDKTVATLTDDMSGYELSLALKSDSKPVLAFVDYTADNVQLALCDATCNSVTLRTLDSTVTNYPVVAIAGNGDIFVAYDKGVDVKLRRCLVADTTCAAMPASVVIGTGLNDYYLDVTTNASNFAVVAATAELGGVNLITATNASGSSATISNIPTLHTANDAITLELEDGLPRLAWISGDATGQYASCIDAVGATCFVMDFDTDGSYSSSMATGSDGLSRILYDGFDNATDIVLLSLVRADGFPSFSGSTVGTASRPFGALDGVLGNLTRLDVSDGPNVLKGTTYAESLVANSLAAGGLVAGNLSDNYPLSLLGEFAIIAKSYSFSDTSLIGGTLWFSNGAFNSPGYFDAAASISAVWDPASTVQGGLGLYVYGGSPHTRLERVRLTQGGVEVKSAPLTAPSYRTTTNCADGTATPADCGSAAAGAVIISAGATTVVVNDTAITAASRVTVTQDQSLGSELSVTCNSQSSLTLGSPRVTARTAGVSFTVGIDVAPTTNPMCLVFHIEN